ncbi:TonB-dependent receptor [Pseudoxanthomonas yeongjuensis]|uniref:TonB-dependent receptor n=1 Tax=Pseudoxanthomonas yeongjuensis TaxID=377616 RepID=UPI001FE469D4|nr:TonB-dependent receptor [Pseudoxanthomonas yeongjuensis]
MSLALCSAPIAVYAQVTHVFNLPTQPLADSLRAVGSKAGVNVAFDPAVVKGRKAKALKGSFTVKQALQQLIEGTGLTVRATDGGTFLIETVHLQASIGNAFQGEIPAAPQSGSTAAESPAADAAGSLRQESQVRSGAAASKASGSISEMDAMVVTGTRIRGGTTASPLITIDAKQIREEGFTDLGEVIRSVPQNFRGGQNPGVVNGGNVIDQNMTGGSGLNLRGLGPDASLTLLNGRRMAYGGFAQAVDISAIPLEAVERIEIVTDGASAIYGSDAVGGVGNVILKREFEGVTLGARYGTATDGGLTTREYTATAGAVWSSGGLIATYKDSSSDPIYADQREYTEHLISPRAIYPGLELQSGLVSAHQSLGEVAELRLDALRTEREQIQYLGLATYYNFYKTNNTTSLVSPSVEFWLGKDWTLSLAGTRAKDEALSDVTQVIVATGASAPLATICHCNESRSYEASAEGPLFPMGGGDARLAVGLGYRTNEYLYRSNTVYGDSESSRFAYAELNLPFISPESNLVGANRLAMTLAVRGEDYDEFGRVTTPKVGLLYDPNKDFTLKASWGKSFKGPTLEQRSVGQYGVLYDAGTVGGTGYAPNATALMAFGGNPDLGPERARTWTASMAFHPEAVPGLEAELTWFDIDYTDRVLRPMLINFALSTPAYADFITYSPTPAQQAEILAMPIFVNASSAPYDADTVVAILHNQYTNMARQRLKGLDLSGSYRLDLGSGRVTIRGSASWLDSSQQNSAGQSSYQLSGTIFNPAKLNGRLGLVWSRGGFTASAFASYTDGLTYDVAGIPRETASFTTFDATMNYATSKEDALWSGFEFSLSAQNLFDRPPPYYLPASPTIPPYDSLNHSAIGRYLSVSVSKHW